LNAPHHFACGLAFVAAAATAVPAEHADTPPAPSTYTYVHHPVSTGNAAAQFAFDRGLTMIFAYEPREAQQAFRQAARLDPTLAMAWWGIGLSVGPNINMEPVPERTVTAADALARATLLAAKRATSSERDYIAALGTRYTSAPDPDFDQLATAYRSAMRSLVQKYPEDADARALFAEAIMDLHPWRLWNASGDPETGTPELVETIEQGLAKQPSPAAHRLSTPFTTPSITGSAIIQRPNTRAVTAPTSRLAVQRRTGGNSGPVMTTTICEPVARSPRMAAL
jgi:hypothetical protein